MKKVIALLLTSVLFFSILPMAGAAGNSISVTLDGRKLSFDVSPESIGGRTMIPYRTLAEQLGAKVTFDGKSKVSVTKASAKVDLTIGSKTASVNGKNVTMDAAPVQKNGRTLVPLRFLGEAFGLFVNWNKDTRTVELATGRTVTHAMGSTKLNAVPKRVVVLFNGMVDISLTMGVKPVGAVESWVQQPWYHYLRSDMVGVKNLGNENQPNLEAIVALKPDVIIGSKLRHEKIYDQLSKIAPTVMTEDVFDWKTNVKVAADVLNKEEEAAKFIQDWNNRVADFKNKMGSRLNTEVSIMRFQPDGTARVYVSGFAGTILAELGLKRPKAQQVEGKVVLGVTSKEQIPLLDGDVIFDITSDWQADEKVFKTQQDWMSNPLWTNLKGIKNGKYYKVNDVTWNMSGGATAAKMMLDDLYFYFDLE